jgi:GAF domain
MEPIPETQIALTVLAEYGETELSDELLRIGRQVKEIVPEIIGMSFGVHADNFTFTLLADTELARELDVVQYVDDGPCVEVARGGEALETTAGDLLDEGRWLMFARAQAAEGVASSLSLPISRNGRVVAGVNLYASTADAFEGHVDELTEVCGAWAPGVVANADLSFTTRTEAVATPGRVRDQQAVDKAIGILAEAQGIHVDVAAERLLDAASRAGITEAQAARAVIRVLTDD